jgi:uncharacterized protein (UPF0332 family)
MKLSADERDALVSYRIQKANDTLEEAEGISSLGYWNAVANRLYYACYYATSALLIKNSFQAQTHRGVITLLGMHFIKTGKISENSGKLFSRLFELRQTGDYDDLFDLSEEDVQPLLKPAKEYIKEISNLL